MTSPNCVRYNKVHDRARPLVTLQPIPRFKPVDWRIPARIFGAPGLSRERMGGSHVILAKPETVWPVIMQT